MISLHQILSSPIVNRIGLAIMHSVWECTAVGVLFAVVTLALRKRRAQVRYNIAVTALLLMVIVPVITFFVVGGPAKTSPDAIAAALAGKPVVAAVDESVTSAEITPVEAVNLSETPRAVPAEVAVQAKPAGKAASITEKIEIAGPYLALGWIVGVLVLSIWHLGGWAQLRRLRRVMVKPVEEHVTKTLKRLADSLAVTRTIEIVESALVTVPTVIGAFKPVVLLPASALTGLTAQQLEMILAHELAHIKRGDFLVNLIQTAIDILLFYHPAAWYVSRRIRDERENCCDDIAVQVTGDSLKYARALATLEEIKATNRRLAVAATGGSFFDRVARLVGKEESRKTKPSWQTVVITMLVVTAVIMPLCFAMNAKTTDPKAKQLVEDFFEHNYRDITARKSIEWGDQSQDEKGNISIRYKFEATIRGKDKIVNNAVFTFDKNGKFVSVEKLKDATTKEGLQTLVMEFFGKNYRDISSRKTIEWGEPVRGENGNASIRYKYEATIRGEKKIISNQTFTFDKDGKFLSVEDVEESGIENMPEFKAKLANGVEVELVALCSGRSEKDRIWWLPDGRVVDVGEFAKYTEDVNKIKLEDKPGEQFKYSYLFRANPTEDVTVRSDVSGGTRWHGRYAKDKTTIGYVYSSTANYDNFPKTGSIKIATAEGEYKEIVSELYRGSLSDGTVLEDRKTNVSISGPRTYSNYSEKLLDVSITSSQYDIKVVAQLKDGRKIDGRWESSTGGPSITSFVTRLNPMIRHSFRIFADWNNIEKFIIKYRKFDVMTFKDVSLKAGHKTDVTVVGGEKVKKMGLMDAQIDFSAITSDTTLAEAVDRIRKSLPSSVSVVVLWNDLAENAFVEPDSHVGVDGIGKTSLRNGLDIISRSMSDVPRLKYVYVDGVITIMTDEGKSKVGSGDKSSKAAPVISKIDEASKKLLDTRVDFSFVTTDTTFEEVIVHLRNQKIPGLSIVVMWNLVMDAFVDKDTSVGIDGINTTTMKTGLELILKSVGGNLAELTYTCKDGVLVIETSEDSRRYGFIIQDPAPPIVFPRHYVRLIGVEDGFVFEGRRYKELSELDEPLSKLADRSNTVLEWAFATGQMPKEKNSMAWLGIVYFISDLEKLVDKHGLGGLCYAGELPVESKRVSFPAGTWNSFAMDKEIELDLKNGPIELKSIKFVKDAKQKRSPYKALINAKVTSWPKTKIEIRMELKSKGADDQNAVLYKTFENSGIMKGIAKTGIETIEIPFFGDIDDGFIEDVKMVEVRIRQIGADLDKAKAAKIIDKWTRAFESNDVQTIKETVGPGNEKALEELKRMASLDGSKSRPSPRTEKDPVILNITKANDGKYRVLALTINNDISYYQVHMIIPGADGFKVAADLDSYLKTIRDARTMSAKEIGKRMFNKKVDRWKNAEGEELEGVAKGAIQQFRDMILAADYGQKHKIKIANVANQNIAEIKSKLAEFEKMSPEQVREFVLKEYEDTLQKYNGNTKPGKTSDPSESSKTAGTGHSNDDKSLAFLSGIREFRDLRLGMDEKAFQRHIDSYSLKPDIEAIDDSVVHHLYNQQGENVIVTFRKGKCVGIQRMRKDPDTAAKIYKTKNANSLGPAGKPVSEVSDLIAIYQVIGHENALPFKSKDPHNRRRIIFGDRKSDKGASRFDPMKPENYPLEGLIVADKPLISESDIVSYDWQKHIMQVKPDVFPRFPKVTSVWGSPFVVVAAGKPQYLGAFWPAGSSYMASMPTISTWRWDGKLPKNDPAYLPKNSIRIKASMISSEGKEASPNVRNNINVLKALKEAGIITGDKSGADNIPGKREKLSMSKDYVLHLGATSEMMIDFDSGKTVKMPGNLSAIRNKQQLMELLAKIGADTSVKVRSSMCYIGLIDSFAWQVDNKKWKTITPQEISGNSELVKGEIGYGNITKKLDDLPRTYIFKTRQGTMGIFQVSNLKGTPAGVKISSRIIE